MYRYSDTLDSVVNARTCAVYTARSITVYSPRWVVFYGNSSFDSICDFHRGLRVFNILRSRHEVGGHPAILEKFSDGGQVVERCVWR